MYVFRIQEHKNKLFYDVFYENALNLMNNAVSGTIIGCYRDLMSRDLRGFCRNKKKMHTLSE